MVIFSYYHRIAFPHTDFIPSPNAKQIDGPITNPPSTIMTVDDSSRDSPTLKLDDHVTEVETILQPPLPPPTPLQQQSMSMKDSFMDAITFTDVIREAKHTIAGVVLHPHHDQIETTAPLNPEDRQ